MKNAVFHFELASWLKSPLFYLLTGSFFLFSFVSTLGTGGFFDAPVPSSQQAKLINTPYALCLMSFLMVKLLLFVTAIFGGFSLYRDYKNNTYALLYSYPISPSYYLKGKLGSVVVVLAASGIIAIAGIYVAELILGVNNPRVGANTTVGYLIALGLYLVPTVVTIGVFVFVSVGISRKIVSGFIVVICFVLLQIILENTLFGYKTWLALLDPFGQSAFHLATQHWDFEMQNSNAFPISLIVIFNRALWLLLALLLYYFFAKRFDFEFDSIWSFQTKPPKAAKMPMSRPVINPGLLYDFSAKASIWLCLRLIVYDFKSIAKTWMFLLLSLFGGVALFFIHLRVSNTGTFTMLPLTRTFIGAPLSIYTVIIILSTFLFSGTLVNRARQYKMNLMTDATPVANWQLIYAKVGAIGLVQIVQLLLFLLVSLSIQLINGYYKFELGLFAFQLFILVLPVLFVWNLTSHFIHALFPNIFFSLFVLLCIWLGAQTLEEIGIQTYLLKYNQLPPLTYSGFNGYGHLLNGYMQLVAYWLLFGGLCALGTGVVWIRGSSFSIKERAKLAMSRFSPLLLFSIALLILLCCWTAGRLYRAEYIEQEAAGVPNNYPLETYKKEWSPYGRLPQPKITAIDLNLDIYPDKESFHAKGQYTLVNQSNKRIDTIFIRTSFDEITQLDWNGLARLLKEDARFKSYLYKLSAPLLPGDSLQLSFCINNTPNSLFSRNSNVLSDGTYLKQDILPRIGYSFVQHELPLKDRSANDYNYYHRDADYTTIHTTITTSKGQIAIAPGELIAQQSGGERNTYEYDSPQPVKLNFSFHSAAYEVRKDSFAGLSIQLYYKKGHHHNIEHMMEGLKASLRYNTELFAPYPYQEIRIVEFPHTENNYSATLTANNIPASEVLFNINAESMKGKFNLPFYVVAHELAHEWFGNQMIPADAEGAKMLTESIAEYLTLCVYREHFGDSLSGNFLAAQRNRYLRGKRKESEEEMPLNRVLAHQEYIAYGKGAIAFDIIAEAIGRDAMNSILQEFLLKYKSIPHYYPTTNDFIEFLKRNTGEESHGLIDRWLTRTDPL